MSLFTVLQPTSSEIEAGFRIKTLPLWSPRDDIGSRIIFQASAEIQATFGLSRSRRGIALTIASLYRARASNLRRMRKESNPTIAP
jgi:hypothetical protein